MSCFYNIKVNVIQVTRTNDGLGGTEALTTRISNLPGKWEWTSGTERLIYGKTGKVKEATFFCNVVTIDQNDRITYNGKTYEILNIFNVDERNKYLKIDLGLSE